MAIVDLEKLSVIALNADKTEILKSLMSLGFVEMNGQDDKLADQEWSSLIKRDGNYEKSAEVESKLSEVSSAIEVLDKYFKGKKPLIKCRKAVSESEFAKKTSDSNKAFEMAERINALYKEIHALKAEKSRLETLSESLKLWSGYSFPLEMKETKFTSIVLGTIPVTATQSEIESRLSENTEGAVLFAVSSDEKQRYSVAVSLKKDTDTMLDILRQEGFNPVSFEDVKGTAAENIVKCEKGIKDTATKIATAEEKMSAEAENIQILEFLYDSLSIEKERYNALNNILTTKETFYFDGWIPKNCEEKIKKVLDKYGCYYEIKEREKGEQMPILLKENSLVEPFRAITDLYSTPSINDIDPTPFLAPFYFIFFGMMLSDAGYGIVIAVACFALLKMYRLEGMMKRLIKMFAFCGISTAFWGFMFGGFFGDITGLKAIWFNPINNPMKLLIFSLILGAIHLFAGMGIKAYLLIKNGQILDAVCDIFLWYDLLIGLVLWGIGSSSAIPVLSSIGKWMSIVGAIGILVTGGRHKKGLGKVTGGVGSLYGITGYLSDVLSYSRLLALGLATGVVAQVVNTLGRLIGNGFIGIIIMIVIFIIGHIFNLIINTLGSFVHSSRLQYVEFFGKFYEGGGTAFNPFNRKTKYMEIIKEEK
ncbi:MAG: V-type ATP synthase subunit I [Clostridia bacterium]|jgi:V/A-type H+-transporting ATPase subunit I|nr:V-type ATP synthase subunit I [Clostridia bacterium]MCI1999099.1 V-type ATP synthase subunit I [Clostridia bacterium]MCI2013849.1 V-type ATP synthase subunit I [Clostridia bacterium]